MFPFDFIYNNVTKRANLRNKNKQKMLQTSLSDNKGNNYIISQFDRPHLYVVEELQIGAFSVV